MADENQTVDQDESLAAARSSQPDPVDGELITEKVERAAERAAERFISASFSFSGPIPPPQTLMGYEKALPGLADRCVTMAEKEQEFRHDCKRTEVRNNNERARDGQRFALAIAVLFIAVSAAVILAGYPVSGTILGTIDLVAIVAIFVTGRYFTSRDEKDRAKILADAIRQSDQGDEDED